MKSGDIIKTLYKNLRDLEILKKGEQYDISKTQVDIITHIVEDLCPRKACELFKVLNIFNVSPILPESITTMNELIVVFETQGELIDDLIDRTKTDESVSYFPKSKMTTNDIVDNLIKQMMSNANDATWHIEVFGFLDKRKGKEK